MRVVSWNLGHMSRGGFNRVENRRRQWHFLLTLNPDLMLLQECRPEDIAMVESAATSYRLVGQIPSRWIACSAVVARIGLDLQPYRRKHRWLEFLSGYVALATIRFGRGRLLVASVHARAKEVDDDAVSDEDHRLLRLSNCERAWYRDVAFAALDALPKPAGFICGGDWNIARLFDSIYPDGFECEGPTGTEFFGRAAERGWVEMLRRCYPEEVRTFLRPNTKPYQLDHLFTDPATHETVIDCDIIAGLPVSEISDHAALVVDLALEHELD